MQQKQNIFSKKCGITRISALKIPKMNPTHSKTDGKVLFLIASVIININELMAAIADAGPAGPMATAI